MKKTYCESWTLSLDKWFVSSKLVTRSPEASHSNDDEDTVSKEVGSSKWNVDIISEVSIISSPVIFLSYFHDI